MVHPHFSKCFSAFSDLDFFTGEREKEGDDWKLGSLMK